MIEHIVALLMFVGPDIKEAQNTTIDVRLFEAGNARLADR